MFKDYLVKIKPVNVTPKKSKNHQPYDELEAELVGYKKQFIQRCKYIFENDKAVKCFMEIESDNPVFLKSTSFTSDLEKNVIYDGNIKKYEWSDDYFLQKGKGCSKEEVKIFLKKSGFKIKK